MADAIELATAYLALVPSMQGAQKSIAADLIPGATEAAEQAGKEGGGRFNSALLKYAAPAAIAGGVVAGFKGLYEVGGIFDDVADTIRVGTGLSGEALDGLVDSATNVGKKVPAQFEQIGPVVADLNTRLGLSGDTLETVASQYLEAGRVLGEDVDIAQTSAAFSAFKIEGEAVEGAMDQLFRTSQATGVGMNELATQVQQNAPAMQNLGFSFEETAALVGSLDKAGLNSTATLASMSKGLVTLARDGEEPQEAFRRITGEIEGLIEKGDTAAAIDLAAGVFGTRGASQFVGAVQSGTLALDDLVAGMGASGDTILGVGEETMDFAERWQVVKNNALAALEPLGSAVFGALGDTLLAMTPTLEAIGSWLGENTWAFGVIAGIVGGALVAAFAAWAVSAWAATAAMLANPVTWIVLGIVALIAALVLLIANWDTVAAWISNVWSGIVEWLGNAWDSIKGALETAWNGITSFLQAWGPKILLVITGPIGWLVGWLASNWESIKATAVRVWDAVVGFVSSIPSRILGALAALGQLAGKMLGWVQGAKDAAVGKFNEVVAWVGGIPGRILSALGNLGSLLVGAGRSILEGFLSGLKKGFEAVKDFVGGIAGWIADNKGPKAYDLALLVPAGGWIMTGLRHGLEREIPALQDTMSDITGVIRVGAPDAVDLTATGGHLTGATGVDVAAGAGGTTYNLEVHNPEPEPASRSLVNALAKVAYLGLGAEEE